MDGHNGRPGRTAGTGRHEAGGARTVSGPHGGSVVSRAKAKPTWQSSAHPDFAQEYDRK